MKCCENELFSLFKLLNLSKSTALAVVNFSESSGCIGNFLLMVAFIHSFFCCWFKLTLRMHVCFFLSLSTVVHLCVLYTEITYNEINVIITVTSSIVEYRSCLNLRKICKTFFINLLSF